MWVSFSSVRLASGSSSWLLNFLRSCQGRSLCLGRGRAGVRGRLSVCTSIHPASCLPTSLSACPPTRALCQEPPKLGAGDMSLPGDSPLWDPLCQLGGGRLGTLPCTPPPIVPAPPRRRGSQPGTPLTWMSPSPPWGCHHHKDVTTTRTSPPHGALHPVALLGKCWGPEAPTSPLLPHGPHTLRLPPAPRTLPGAVLRRAAVARGWCRGGTLQGTGAS